ncbi:MULTISPECIES: hypothetical protein [Streptomyces]|uniref:hypothetical protein n=1 Tax=Streptomyces TaxID=1883 RepID=UPI002DD8D758|nr:hypothetical protein [Streptomyces hirsutus]
MEAAAPLRGRPGHVLLLYATDVTDLVSVVEASGAAGAPLTTDDSPGSPGHRGSEGDPEIAAVLSREAAPTAAAGPVIPAYHDSAGEFARLCRPNDATGFVVRPDGQLGARFPLAGTTAALAGYLAALSVPA